jgi:hypothetical protein
MFLSGGCGFQSTKVIPKSVTVEAWTSTASTLVFPGNAVFVMSN